MATPSLDKWRRELQTGQRTPATQDDLWRLAMAEADTLEHARNPGSNRSRKTRAARALREPVIVWANEVTAEEVKWLWLHRIPLGKLTLLEGDPGLGKSTIGIDLAARASTGVPMPDGTPGHSGGTVILSAEDGVGDTIVPRLKAASADLNRVAIITGIDNGDDAAEPVTIPANADALAVAIRQARACLLVVDPLMAFLGGHLNSWRDQDVRRALHPLARLAEETGAAIVAVRHLNKGTGSALYRGGGSIGIAGAARSVLLVGKNPDDSTQSVLAVVKSNLAEASISLKYRVEPVAGAPRIKWEGDSPHRADALVASSGSPDHVSPLDDAKRFLEIELSSGPCPVAEVQECARSAGISIRTLRRAREALRVRTWKEGFGGTGRWVLALPRATASDHGE